MSGFQKTRFSPSVPFRVSIPVLVLVLVLGYCGEPAGAMAVLQKRSTEVCPDESICGWMTYRPLYRTAEDFVQNSCTCREGVQCVRYSDDLSISAYVYRCRSEQVNNGQGQQD